MLSDERIEEVALRLRRSHLHSLIAKAREIESDLEAARRSRQKRARLIKLARKHGFSACLEKLSMGGYLIGRSEDKSYFYYDPQCNSMCKRSWIQQRIEIIESIKALRRASLDTLKANLKGLLQETQIDQEKPLVVRWIMRDVVLNNVWIGDLEVVLYLEFFSVLVYNDSVDIDCRGGHAHPHVDTGSRICWNGHDYTAMAYHNAGEFLALKDLIENLLRTYNPDSPYVSLDEWENGLGEECCYCGDRYPSDDMGYSEAADGPLCSDCRQYCDECGDIVPYVNFDSDWEMCRWCLENLTACCTACEGRYREDELTEVIVDAREGRLMRRLCDDCYSEYEEEQEETHHENQTCA